MNCWPIPAAPCVRVYLSDPYADQLGGDEARHLLAAAFANHLAGVEPQLSWGTLYDVACVRQLHDLADLLLAADGRALPPAEHLPPEAEALAMEAARVAERIRREAATLQLGVVVSRATVSRRSAVRAGRPLAGTDGGGAEAG
ncbi:hypothetical protein ABT160_24555 [Streptomyces sp. NPDC001941]|uniref:hypothetical protein n=1 Tax=Streptomyces sp. NPDC001941 TaxID=3154659 RepID=UPI00331FED9D